MEISTKQIKALDTYYTVAQKEYDDTHLYFDAVDNKVSIFIGIGVAIPSILLSFVKIPDGIKGNISSYLDVLGFAMLLWTFYYIFQALRIRTVSFGVTFDDFQEACRHYDNETIKESVADTWVKAAKKTHEIADKKAGQLRRLHLPFLLSMSLFIMAAIVALI